MPKSAKESTLLRQWELLRMLRVSHSISPEFGKWDRASELRDRLRDQGFDVSLRTVQRDLQTLSGVFGIEVNDKNPRDFGWRWKKGANLNIGGLGASEALMLAMGEQYLAAVLPKVTRESLQPLFDQAKKQLDQEHSGSRSIGKNWLQKVRVISPSLPLTPPHIDTAVQETICQALLSDKQLKVQYRSAGQGSAKELQLHPLGLLMRGQVIYLVASAWDYDHAFLYALHRFTVAEMEEADCRKLNDLDLDQAIAKGLGEFSEKLQSIHLKMRTSAALAAYLAETPLSADQQITPAGSGRMEITAAVNDTWQLHMWLASQGSGVEVVEPASLREYMLADLRRALENYGREQQ